MKKNYQKVIDFLKIITKPWGEKIKYGIELNLPIGVEIAQTDYEALSCLIYDLKGTGKTSGDNDHSNGDETKGANKIKPKECKCGKICHWFSEKCECGSSEFLYGDDDNKTDIRWGIDTTAHFKYKVPNYHFWILEASEYVSTNKIFYLKLFTVSSNNRMFNEILKVQNDSKSKNKNFLPYSKDFYASNPKYEACFKLKFNKKNSNLSISVEDVSSIVLTKKILTQPKGIKRYLPNDFIVKKDIYQYDEIESLLNVKNFKTTHGKKRGETKRRSEQNL